MIWTYPGNSVQQVFNRPPLSKLTASNVSYHPATPPVLRN
jgi:hypothetical protein